MMLKGSRIFLRSKQTFFYQKRFFLFFFSLFANYRMTRLLAGLHDELTNMLACSNYAISFHLTLVLKMAHDSYKVTRFVSLTKNKGLFAIITNGKVLRYFALIIPFQSKRSWSEDGTFRRQKHGIFSGL